MADNQDKTIEDTLREVLEEDYNGDYTTMMWQAKLKIIFFLVFCLLSFVFASVSPSTWGIVFFCILGAVCLFLGIVTHYSYNKLVKMEQKDREEIDNHFRP